MRNNYKQMKILLTYFFYPDLDVLKCVEISKTTQPILIKLCLFPKLEYTSKSKLDQERIISEKFVHKHTYN